MALPKMGFFRFENIPSGKPGQPVLLLFLKPVGRKLCDTQNTKMKLRAKIQPE
jgi:hypothetical protein